MDWMYVGQIIGGVAAAMATAGGLFGTGKWLIDKINAPNTAKFAALGLQLKEGIERIDADVKEGREDMKAFRAEMTAVNQRIDTSYQMFVDLLRDSKKEKAKGE